MVEEWESGDVGEDVGDDCFPVGNCEGVEMCHWVCNGGILAAYTIPRDRRLGGLESAGLVGIVGESFPTVPRAECKLNLGMVP